MNSESISIIQSSNCPIRRCAGLHVRMEEHFPKVKRRQKEVSSHWAVSCPMFHWLRSENNSSHHLSFKYDDATTPLHFQQLQLSFLVGSVRSRIPPNWLERVISEERGSKQPEEERDRLLLILHRSSCDSCRFRIVFVLC